MARRAVLGHSLPSALDFKRLTCSTPRSLGLPERSRGILKRSPRAGEVGGSRSGGSWRRTVVGEGGPVYSVDFSPVYDSDIRGQGEGMVVEKITEL